MPEALRSRRFWRRAIRTVLRRLRRRPFPPRIAKRPCDADDVRFTYQLFLGRDAEPDALVGKAGYPLGQAISILLGSDEFADRVLRPVLNGASPMVENVLVSPALVDWTVRTLPLTRAAKRRLRGVKTWRGLAGLVLSDRSFARLVPDAAATWRSTSFLPRLDGIAATASRAPVGGIDRFDGAQLAGWAFDACDPDRPLRVQVRANGDVIGDVEASAMRIDIRDIHGVGGACGFIMDLSSAGLYADEQPTLIELCDEAGGVVIASRRFMPSGGASSDVIYPLEAYEAYRHRHYGAATSPRRSSGDGPSFAIVATSGGDDGWQARIWSSIRTQEYIRHDDVLIGRGTVIRSGAGRHPAPEATAAREAMVSAQDLDDAVSATKGDYLVFVDDACLAADALTCLAVALRRHPLAAIAYWDEDGVDPQVSADRHLEPCFKPPFDAVWLLQRNFIGSSFAISRRLFDAIDGFRGSGGDPNRRPDRHDLLLRATAVAAPEQVLSIERVLQHRSTSAALDVPDKAAVACRLTRDGWPAVVASPVAGGPHAGTPDAIRIRPALTGTESATVIIASRDKPELLGPCIESLLATRGANRTHFDITVIDHASADPGALALFERLRRDGIDVRRVDGPFNWAAINNAGAVRQTSDVLIFLNDDTRALTPAWCDELCLHAMRSDVGVVGARLLYPDGTVQHAGMVLHGDGAVFHEGLGLPADHPGYLGRLTVVHNVAAVTGACLATRRMHFERLGGFDAINFPVTYNDVDYCVRTRKAGLAVRYTPSAVFEHDESKTRGFDGTLERRTRFAREHSAFIAKWPDLPTRDPFTNAHFDGNAPPYRQLVAPTAG